MNAYVKTAGWLACMVALALGGSALVATLAAHQTFDDAATHTPYSIAAAFPIPVIQAAAPGWDVLCAIWVLLALIALAGQRLVHAIAQLPSGRARVLLIAFLVSGLALSFFAIAQSSDIYFYTLYGRLYGVYGINPYVLASKLPLAAASDAAIAHILPFSNDPPFSDPYGPLWTLLAGLQARMLAGASLYWSVWSFRAVAIAAAVATAAALLHALRRASETDRVRAVGRFAFHPLVLYETAVGGHNDALMIAPAAWAFALVDDLPLIAGLLLGAAIAVKYVALVALPFLAVRARRSGIAGAVLATTLALAVPLLCARPFHAGAASQGVAGASGRFAMSLVWLANMPLFAAGLGNAPVAATLPPMPLIGVLSWGRLVEVGVAGAALVVVVWSALRFARAPAWRYVWRSIAATLLALPSMHPWYGLWIAPAIACDGAWAAYAWWFGVFVFGCYVLDVIGGAGVALWVPVVATLLYLIGPALVAWRRDVRP